MFKSEIRISKSETNPNIETGRKYDLEDRTFRFAESVIRYVNQLPKSVSNMEVSKQLVRAAGSVGANYIEANESLGKKDFLMRIKISRKEAKESKYWIGLSSPLEQETANKNALLQEATELTNIFGAIMRKSS